MTRTARHVGRGIALLLLAAVTAAAQQVPDRSRPPQPGPPPQLDLPAIQRHTLSNGLGVWLVELHEVPLVQVNLVVRAGSGDDPAGKFGAASLTAATLDEGAGSRSALEIADAIDFLGGTLATSSSFDASTVRLNVPVQRLQDALPIMADVALRPTFPNEDLERLRQERLTTLLQARADPRSIASIAFPRLLFGAAHRYGIGAIGTEATLKGLTAEDLRSFHSKFYHPANAALVVSGDVTAELIVPALERHFGPWKGAARLERAAVPAAAQPKARRVYIVDKPDAEQSQIRIGWVGAARSSPHYFPLVVLNTVLGGSFTSRLNQNLREEHGYSYGASSGFEMRRAPGPFVAAAGVQTDKTADALREFFNELNGITQPIGDDELAKAKNYVALSFPSAFETSGDLAGGLELLVVYDLPMDYLDEYVAKIQAVGAADVQKAAAEYIHPSRAVVVIVGDRKAIEPGIKALNLGPVEVMTVDDVLD